MSLKKIKFSSKIKILFICWSEITSHQYFQLFCRCFLKPQKQDTKWYWLKIVYRATTAQRDKIKYLFSNFFIKMLHLRNFCPKTCRISISQQRGKRRNLLSQKQDWKSSLRPRDNQVLTVQCSNLTMKSFYSMYAGFYISL